MAYAIISNIGHSTKKKELHASKLIFNLTDNTLVHWTYLEIQIPRLFQTTVSYSTSRAVGRCRHVNNTFYMSQ